METAGFNQLSSVTTFETCGNSQLLDDTPFAHPNILMPQEQEEKSRAEKTRLETEAWSMFPNLGWGYGLTIKHGALTKLSWGVKHQNR
jgi:hypothetical protein